MALRALRGERGWWVLVIAVVNDHIVLGARGTDRVARAPVELCRGLEVGLLDSLSDSGARGVDAKGELHALNGAGGSILAGLAVALLFSSTLSNEVGRVAVLVVGSLELFDAPGITGRQGLGLGERRRQGKPTGLSPCPACHP